jgi:glycosyltransferase involved in cell wall biosynthesis
MTLDELRARFSRVAVVHDWLTVPGGSEQVVLELLAMFPDAELFTSIYDPAPWPPQVTERRIHASYLNRVPGAARHYRVLLPFMNRAYTGFDLSGFDLVLSSSHACAKNVRAPADALHVCYCHTPMRYAWDEGFLAGEVGPVTRRLLPPLLRRLRRQDVAGAEGPDVFVANSRHVAARIQRYYGRSAEVLYPPVSVERFLALPRTPEPSFYLVFGRVVPYKRVDLAVAACERLGRRVVVAGDGRALPSARSAAGARARFLGRVDDFQRDELFGSAKALLFAGEEDFGIVPVEAQASGVPVIAYGVGGVCESVIDERTGVLFQEQSVEAMADAIARFEGLAFDTESLRQNARRFGRERFRNGMASVILAAADEKAALGAGQRRYIRLT